MRNWERWVREAEQCFDRKQWQEATSLAERALQVSPNCAAAHQVLGLVLSEGNRPQDAIARLTRALAIQPDLVPSHNGLGRCFFLMDNLDAAMQHFDTALRLQPDHGFAHFNRAVALLKLGRYREGWLEYEWRWKCGLVTRPDIPLPRWDGSALGGRSILVHTEQGLGDVLQFIRFLPVLKRQGARVVLACQKPLHGLLRRLPYVDDWFPIDEPGKITFDLYAPLLCLPGLLGIDASSIPCTVPYIEADAERIERWRPRIADLTGCKVGVCWQGSPTFKGNQFRSFALDAFAPVANIPGVTLVSLQKGSGTEQIEPARNRVPVQVFADLDDDAAFVDTAAILHHLDLVITSDTSLAHLAGALGRSVWVPLSTGCDWRWLTERADSPWYPTMQLFRQKWFGDWSGVFQDVAATLRQELASRSFTRHAVHDPHNNEVSLPTRSHIQVPHRFAPSLRA